MYKQSEVIVQLLPVYEDSRFVFSYVLINQNGASDTYQWFLSHCDFFFM